MVTLVVPKGAAVVLGQGDAVPVDPAPLGPVPLDPAPAAPEPVEPAVPPDPEPVDAMSVDPDALWPGCGDALPAGRSTGSVLPPQPNPQVSNSHDANVANDDVFTRQA